MQVTSRYDLNVNNSPYTNPLVLSLATGFTFALSWMATRDSAWNELLFQNAAVLFLLATLIFILIYFIRKTLLSPLKTESQRVKNALLQFSGGEIIIKQSKDLDVVVKSNKV